MAQTQLSKDIKKLNERIADFERSGLTESSQYKTLISQVHAIGVPIKTTKKGNTAIKNTKFMTEEQIAKISKMAESKNTKGQAVKQAKKLIKESGEELKTDKEEQNKQIQDVLSKVNKIEKIIEEYGNAIYSMEIDEDAENYTQIHGNNGSFTLAEIDRIIEISEKSEAERKRLADIYTEWKKAQQKAETDKKQYEQDKIIADKYNTTVETYRKATDFIDTLSPWQVATYKWDIKDVIRAIDNGTFEEFKRQIML